MALGTYIVGQLVAIGSKFVMYVVGMPLSAPLWLRSLGYIAIVLGTINFCLFWRRGVSHAQTRLWQTIFVPYICAVLAHSAALFSGVKFTMHTFGSCP